MKKILFILFAYFCLPSFGGIEGGCQPNRDKYRDKVWLFGYQGQNHVNGFGNSVLTFNNDNTIDTASFFRNMSFSAVSSSLCDTLGNLVCYTNGIYIADKTHQKMINGDSLDYGTYWQQNQDGSPGIQGSITILSIPNNNTNSAVILYHDTEHLSSGGYGCFGLKAATIDFNRNNGKGVVIQKDIQVFSDSMQAPLVTACRHANGRDWWVIGVKWGLGKYYKSLITPNGIQFQPTQIMQTVNTSTEGGSIVAKFSFDGKRYAHHDPKVGTQLYNFDRCTGELSNRQLIPLYRNYRTFYCGIAFSPNSRYLYVTDDSQIVQYDMQAPNIPTSGIVVAEYDGFIDSGFANTAFFLLQLAPNGKIYGNCTGGNHYLHIIHSPNERGLACNVEQHGLRLPTWYDSTMPNFPNFRLGSEPGTVCDSLGIETGVTNPTPTLPKGEGAQQGDFQLSASPNPTSDACTISLTSSQLLSSPFGGQRGFVRLLSSDGRLLETFSNPFLNQSTFIINLKNYAKGVYIVEYAGDGGGSARARVVRQ